MNLAPMPRIPPAPFGLVGHVGPVGTAPSIRYVAPARGRGTGPIEPLRPWPSARPPAGPPPVPAGRPPFSPAGCPGPLPQELVQIDDILRAWPPAPPSLAHRLVQIAGSDRGGVLRLAAVGAAVAAVILAAIVSGAAPAGRDASGAFPPAEEVAAPADVTPPPA